MGERLFHGRLVCGRKGFGVCRGPSRGMNSGCVLFGALGALGTRRTHSIRRLYAVRRVSWSRRWVCLPKRGHWWFRAAQIGFQGEGARHPNSFTGGKLFGQFVFSLVRSIDLGSRPCPQRNQLWKSKLGLTCAVIGCCQLIKKFGWAAASRQKSNPFR